MFNSIPSRYLLATILMSVGTAFAQDHAGVAPPGRPDNLLS